MKPDRLTRVASVLAVAAFALACRSEVPTRESASDPTAELTASLQALVDTAVADNESIHGAALFVAAPGLGFEFEAAAGLADLEAGTPMDTRHTGPDCQQHEDLHRGDRASAVGGGQTPPR